MARNDFMFEEETGDFYQVEFNLFAASLGSICEGTRKVHRALNALTGRRLGDPEKLENTSEFLKALVAGHKAYGNPDAVILMLTDCGSNVFDKNVYLDELALQGYF
jgi:hypothetical protein